MRRLFFALMCCVGTSVSGQTTEVVRTVFADPTYHKTDFNAEEQFLLSIQPGFPRIGGYFVITQQNQNNPVYKAGLYPAETAQLWREYLFAVAMAHPENDMNDKMYDRLYARPEDRRSLLQRNTQLTPDQIEKVIEGPRYFKSRIEDRVTEFDMRRIRADAKAVLATRQRPTNVDSISVVMIRLAELRNYDFANKRFSFARPSEINLPGVPKSMPVPTGGKDRRDPIGYTFPFPEAKAEQLAAVSAQLGQAFSKSRVIYLAEFGELNLNTLDMGTYSSKAKFTPTGFAVSLDPTFTQVLHLHDYKRGKINATAQAAAANAAAAEASRLKVAEAMRQLNLSQQTEGGVAPQAALQQPVTAQPAVQPQVIPLAPAQTDTLQAAQKATQRIAVQKLDLIGLSLGQQLDQVAAHLTSTKPDYAGPDTRAGFPQSCVPVFAETAKEVATFLMDAKVQTKQELTLGQRDTLKELEANLAAGQPDHCKTQGTQAYTVSYTGKIGEVIDDTLTLSHDAQTKELVSVQRLVQYPAGKVPMAQTEASLIDKYGDGFLKFENTMVWVSDPTAYLALKSGGIQLRDCAVQLYVPGDGVQLSFIAQRKPCGNMLSARLSTQQTEVKMVDTARVHALNMARIKDAGPEVSTGVKIDF